VVLQLMAVGYKVRLQALTKAAVVVVVLLTAIMPVTVAAV
jgi:hypothetical protein